MSFGSLLSPFRLFLSKLTRFLKPNFSIKDPVVLQDGCRHPPIWVSGTLYIGSKKGKGHENQR